MDDRATICRNSNVVHRVIGDETVLVPVLKTSKEMDCIYTLNRSAAFVWSMLDGKTSIADIKKNISKDFDATEAEINRELNKLLVDLKEAGAIQR